MIVVDDDIVRIGSANLANRSMGLDTECDLTIEALGRDDVRDAIRDLRARLLGEHLGCEPSAVRETIERTGSLRAAIDELQRERSHAQAARAICRRFPRAMLSVVSVADPEKPVALSDLAKLLSSDDETAADGPRSPAWGKIAMFARRLRRADGAVEIHAAGHIPRRQPHHRLGAPRGRRMVGADPHGARLHAGRVHDVSATADHAVRGHRVRSDAWDSCTRCSASSCPRG